MNIPLLLKNIGNGFRQNLLPGLILQAIALLLGLSYYYLPQAQPFFQFFHEAKSQYGIWYAIVSTAIFGGIIPYLVLRLTGQITATPYRQFWFFTLFWALKGAEVDLFYRFQAYLFGADNHWQTVLIKTTVDQFLYGPFWMVPTIAIAYLWKEKCFDFGATRRSLDRYFFMMTLPTIIISNWLVWLPAITVIYAMPSNLQVPFYNLVQCFFVLLLAFLTRTPQKHN